MKSTPIAAERTLAGEPIHHRTRYRPDIDGLRAVAVLPVVAFHAGLHAVRGGFVGVDVFFVISGFLITQQMFAEITDGRFSILSFYERRIRRILPALIAVLTATYILGLVYCLPSEMADLSKSLVAAALSVSNVFFYFGSGYFDSPAGAKPLLHTWSLAVEEQFYLFWPIFLIVAHRFVGRRVLMLTLGISVASFVASLVGTAEFPVATFYLPFTRIWELAAGGMLSLNALPMVLGKITRNILCASGILLIFASVALTDSSLPFPGLLALPPCAGAVFIILAGRDGPTFVGRLLSLRPITFVGAISYSLYLWHWPVVVFQKNYAFLSSGLSDRNGKILIVAVSVLLATLSWKLIEEPFRKGPHRPDRRLLLTLAASGTVLAVVLGVVGWYAQGFPTRYSARELEVASFLSYDASETYRVGSCFITQKVASPRFADDCLALSSTKKNYLLLGDSHAAELWHGLHALAPDKNILLASASDCFPTLTHELGESRQCSQLLDDVITDYLPAHPVDNVLIAARWKESTLSNLAGTLDWMKERGIRVTLIGPSVLYDSPLPHLMVSALRISDPTLPQHHVDNSMLALDDKLSMLAQSRGVTYVSLIKLMCSAQQCRYQDEQGLPLILDREHFTASGSMVVARKLLAFQGDMVISGRPRRV